MCQAPKRGITHCDTHPCLKRNVCSVLKRNVCSVLLLTTCDALTLRTSANVCVFVCVWGNNRTPRSMQ